MKVVHVRPPHSLVNFGMKTSAYQLGLERAARPEWERAPWLWSLSSACGQRSPSRWGKEEPYMSRPWGKKSTVWNCGIHASTAMWILDGNSDINGKLAAKLKNSLC